MLLNLDLSCLSFGQAVSRNSPFWTGKKEFLMLTWGGGGGGGNNHILDIAEVYFDLFDTMGGFGVD